MSTVIINSLTNLINDFFKSNQIYVPLQWITSFLEWYTLENKDLDNNDEMIAQAYQQWLLSDLKTFQISSLPANLNNQIKFIINGTYCLQINKIMDISKPKLQQLNQRLKKHCDNNDKGNNNWQLFNNSSRMLQLTLTDGVQIVEAIEFRPIQCLELAIVPGSKIQLIGPIPVRRGRIMLEAHNIKLLGGEVDDLKVMNTVENVLTRELKLLSTTCKLGILDLAKEFKGNSNTPIKECVTPKLSDNDLEIDEEFLLQIEEELKGKTKLDPDMCQTDVNDICIRQSKDSECQNQQNIKELLNLSVNNFELDNTELLDVEDEIFNEIKDLELHREIVEDGLDSKSEVKIVYAIKEVEVDNIKRVEYLIKGKFERVVEKFTVNNNSLHFLIEVSDNSGRMILKVSPEVVCKFAECNFEELLNYKTVMLGSDLEAKKKIYKVLENIKNKFEALDNVVQIKYDLSQKVFILKNVYD